jgi:hypothetical protein
VTTKKSRSDSDFGVNTMKLPEWLHLRNADGSVTTKRRSESTLDEFRRYTEQKVAEAEAYLARARHQEQLAQREMRGEVPAGTAAQYAASIKELDDEFELLYRDSEGDA